LVKAYEASGESQRTFCARQGIGQSTLRYWRRRLKEVAGEGTGNGGARLVAVKVCEDKAKGEASGLSVVAGNGLRIEVARDFDRGTLERLVVSLRGLG
jgi:transposase-like protein